jgi:ethanolamine utilization protein EutQ (cupin superfamily)
MTEAEQEAIETAWEEDYFDGMEELGWNNDDTEYILQGPLELTDESGTVVAQGEE